MNNCQASIIMHYAYENELMKKLYTMLRSYDVVVIDTFSLGTKFTIESKLKLNQLFMKKYPNEAFTPLEALEATKYGITNNDLCVSDPMSTKSINKED